MAVHFVTHAIDGLLEGNKSFVVCYSGCGFHHKHIDDVAFKKYQIDSDLLKLGMEYGNNK